MTAPNFGGQDLQLELLDPGCTELVRLFRHPGGEWEPPPEQFRNLRVDPPEGHKGDYAILYTATTVATAAVECRILQCDTHDRYTWAADRAAGYRVARYGFSAPALFVPIDRPNSRVLGLEGSQRKIGGGYGQFQDVAHQLFKRYGKVVHGLSWASFHRDQPGRVYAVWHHHKTTIDLTLMAAAPYVLLVDDDDWNQYLKANPQLEELRPAPN